MAVTIPYAWSRGRVSARVELDGIRYVPYVVVLGREVEGRTCFGNAEEATREVRRMCSELACQLAEVGDDALLEFWSADDAIRWERVRREHRRIDAQRASTTSEAERMRRARSPEERARRAAQEEADREAFLAMRREIAESGTDLSDEDERRWKIGLSGVQR